MMTRPTTVVFLLAGAALLHGSGVARAQPKSDDARTCALESGHAALDGCTRAIASRRFGRSELALLHYRRGLLRREANDLDGAIADFTTAIHLHGDVIPTSADAFDVLISQRNAYRQRGQAFADKSDYDHALADVDTLLNADAKDVRALALRAGIRVKQGDCAHAMADFDAIVAIDAKTWDGYLGRARCYATLGERDRAVADYRSAIAGGVSDAVRPQILEELQKLGATP